MTDADEQVERFAVAGGAWIFANEAVADLARESMSYIDAARPADLDRIARLIGDKPAPSAGGTMFEFMHAFNFNRAAWLEGATSVARMTAESDATAAADIHIIGPNNEILREIQAKAYENPKGAVGALLPDKYAGMDALIPEGQETAFLKEVARGLGQPERNIFHARFRDLDRRVGEEIEVDGVSGGPVRLEEARTHRDPAAWIEDQRRAAVLEEVVNGTLTAGAAGFVAGAGLTAVVRGTIAVLHPSNDAPVSRVVADVARASAVSGVRSGSTSALANLARIGVREAGIATSSEALRFASEGATPFVAANLVVSVTEQGMRFARGDIDRDELIESCAAEALRSSVGWAFGVAGQVVIPIPVVGSAVGAVVGYTVSAAVMEGLKVAGAAAVAADAAEARVQVLRVEVVAACQGLEEERRRLELLQREEHAAFVQQMMPSLDAVEHAALRGDDAAFLEGLLDINRSLGAKLEWSSRDEFDGLMADDNWTFEL